MAKKKPEAPAEEKAPKAKPAKAKAAPAPEPAPAPAPEAPKAKGKKAAAAAAPAPAPAPEAPKVKGKKAVAAPAPAPAPAPVAKGKTKSAIYQHLADKLQLNRKQVAAFFDELLGLIRAELGPTGPGTLSIPGLIKLKRNHKEAVAEHEQDDRFNPGKKIIVKAKPARTEIKVRPLKNLKELIK
ncbi:HU family DNA-binding protein [Tuwongella immobilis]|uniref:Uncharacterized protein n=1 Tax=Tuwongella immobilis TaxID=692036 RepID=A0A6C2YNL7_9BACT|nr:HU family DNA-binding protein [Tuwongella immobilis]VIP02482.1 dna-binding protein : Histone family protein DNA-binding protein OS=Planctomyces limnophilus (strain ATCC 43296 / DSM 3776 / IFAM 1008 / 290) GN=Plim_0054 PE=4 SV=1: Bac_DNA_binding [Tuwongella immobilis]VTS01532.1 dna-binding protein : Histone family protein DNA-binding protein OS=Planctomyces limnophilus (strain ATCC 43296 / DSM 3776 / IFAM 1008 / 290) GN=Plim_0054 PE=4 SV=1: Bac_DNA_binding [Tuwongella immobilis]